MRLDQFPHLGIDPLLDLLDEEPFTDLLQIRQRPSAQHFSGLVDQIRELHRTELMCQAGGDHGDELTDTHVALAESLAGENDGGESGNQRSVEIEERSDLRAARACHHLRHRSGQSHVAHV